MGVRGERPPIGLAWVITWPLTAVLAAVVFLSAEELRLPQRGPVATPSPASGPEWYAQLPPRIAALDRALRAGPLGLAAPVEEMRGAGPLRFKFRSYEVQLSEAQRATAEAAIEAVRTVDPGLVITSAAAPDHTEVRFGLDGLLVATVRLLWRERPEARPRLALVLGPVGGDLRIARHAIEAVDGPFALGVDPGLPFAAQVAALARHFERETIVQYVVAPARPVATPGEAAAPAATPVPLEAALAAMPGAVAVAWTSRSGVPGSPAAALSRAAAARHLPLWAPRAGAESAALVMVDGAAADLGARLTALADRARTEGRLVAIAPPSDAVLTALRDALPQWRAAQLDVVAPSALTAGAAAAPLATPALSAR